MFESLDCIQGLFLLKILHNFVENNAVMIDPVRLYRDLVNTAKIGTSGYLRESEINDALSFVQTSLMGTLAPLFAVNRSVKDLLAPFIVSDSLPAPVINKPEDYFQLISMNIDDVPVRSLPLNSKTSINSVPSRRPSDQNGILYYVEESDSFFILPSTVASSVEFLYIRHPLGVSITLTPSSTDDSDYLIPSASDSLEWPERAYNIIFYMMLDKLGVAQKESLLMEYSNLGIQQEAAKL